MSIYIATFHDRSHIKAAVQRQPQVRTVLEWRRLAANRKVRRMAASVPNTAPVVHFTSLPPAEAGTNLYCLVNRGTCVNNLRPRDARSGGIAGNRTCDLSITSPTPYRSPDWTTAIVCLLVSQLTSYGDYSLFLTQQHGLSSISGAPITSVMR